MSWFVRLSVEPATVVLDSHHQDVFVAPQTDGDVLRARMLANIRERLLRNPVGDGARLGRGRPDHLALDRELRAGVLAHLLEVEAKRARKSLAVKHRRMQL